MIGTANSSDDVVDLTYPLSRFCPSPFESTDANPILRILHRGNIDMVLLYAKVIKPIM